MKQTGIIRRIDELGRIVIPKEIRKTLKIKNGETLEIQASNDTILLKKYSELDTTQNLINLLTQSLYKTLKVNIIFTDLNKIISSNNQEISEELINIIQKRKITETNELTITNKKEIGNFIITPIIINGDALGSIIAYSQKNLPPQTENSLNLIQNILTTYIEN